MLLCKIVCDSNSPHLSQIYTGFSLLHQAGDIVLSQECRKQNLFDASKPQHLRDAKHAHLLVIVNDEIKLYYDCHDSHEIDETAASKVDCYFKRSYDQSRIPRAIRSTVFSLGLNYEVYPNLLDSFEQHRLKSLRSPHDVPDTARFRPTVERMYALPKILPARVLFMTRAWDPFDHPDRSEEKIAERVCINESRARCVKLLKRAFGDSVMAGLLHTEYAAQQYADVLLPDNRISEKQNYLKLLAHYPICVTTTGLHGSIGWKMGEYVAFSRAIVSEKLNHDVPGDFKQGQNFLAFDEPDQCASVVNDLLSDSNLRYAMMEANHDYYLNYLKPDVMIRRTLRIGLTGSDDTLKQSVPRLE